MGKNKNNSKPERQMPGLNGWRSGVKMHRIEVRGHMKGKGKNHAGLP